MNSASIAARVRLRYGFRGAVYKLHRSFVGSPRLRRGLRFLRMTMCWVAATWADSGWNSEASGKRRLHLLRVSAGGPIPSRFLRKGGGAEETVRRPSGVCVIAFLSPFGA
jgi:hypothetical protein